MDNKIKTPTIGQILKEEFLDPLDITAYRLAKDIGVPSSRVLEILHDRRKITPDTSLRLAKYFGLSDKYFLNLQNDIDIRLLKENQKDEFDKIIIIHNLFGTVKITDSWDYEKDMMQLLSFYCDTDENFGKVAEFWYEPLNEIIKIKR